MTSAFTFERVGVVFGIDENGQQFIEARTDYTLDAVIKEIDRRCELMLPMLPFPTSPIVVPQLARITNREAKRWGECMTCADPMKPHVGGMCALCIAALKKAYRKLGVLP